MHFEVLIPIPRSNSFSGQSKQPLLTDFSTPKHLSFLTHFVLISTPSSKTFSGQTLCNIITFVSKIDAMYLSKYTKVLLTQVNNHY